MSDLSYNEMQQDINCLSQWSQDNILSFNVTKCKCMLLTNRHNVPLPTLVLNDQPLEYVKHYKYLGVTVSHNLSWAQHIQDICKKARKVLGTIYHKISKHTHVSSTLLKLYTALVRPHLEYAAQVWNPHLEKDIQNLEKVQKFALRICAKDYHASYEDLLDLFCSFLVPYARCNALKFSFFCNIVRLWNCMPPEVHTSEHLLQFKHIISPLFL